MIRQLAGLFVRTNLVDVIPRDSRSNARIPVTKRLSVPKVAVVSRVADVKVCADVRFGTEGLANRIDPGQILADLGRKLSLGLIDRRTWIVVHILDGHTNPGRHRISKQIVELGQEARPYV